MIVGIISIVFTLLGIGLIHLEINEVKNNGFSFASVGLILFSALWIVGWVAMAISNLVQGGASSIEIFGFTIAN